MTLCLLCTAVMYNFILPTHLSSKITRILLIIVCLIGLMVSRRIHTRTLAFSAFFLFYLLFYIGFTRYNINEFLLSFMISFIVICVYCIEMVRKDKEKYIINAFINVMTVISIVSVFFWVFGTLLEIIPPTASMQYIRGNIVLRTKTHYFIYFSNEVQKFVLFGYNMIRNVGIFSEAPSFVSPLLYAIGGELFFNGEKINRWKIGILTAAAVTSLSSKGFIGLIIILMIRYLFFHKARSRVRTAIILVLSVFIIVIGSYLISVILLEKSYSATGIDRIMDLQAAMRAFSGSPIFGVGFNNFDKVHSFGSSSMKGMSMGIPTLLAYGGIYLLIPFLLPLLIIIFGNKSLLYRKEMICFSIIVIFDFFVSIMHSNPCLFTVVGFAYGVILKNRAVKSIEGFDSNG